MSESEEKKGMGNEGGIVQDILKQLDNARISRRQALAKMAKLGIGIAAAAAIGGGGAAAYYSYTKSHAPSGGTIDLFTYSPLYSPSGYVDYLKSTYNITLVTSLGSAATLGDQIVSSGGTGWDTAIFWGAFSKPIINASPPVLQPYPVSAVPKWTSANLDPLFVEPQSKIGDVMGTQMQNDMWWPGKIGTAFAAMPPMYGVDSFAMNPQMIDHLLTSWGDMMDRQWKGKVALQDIPTVAINNFALYLVKSNQMAEPAQIDNLTPSEVDTVINYLKPNIAAGQVKAFWADYGTSVTLMTSGEVWIADIWNAAVFATRAAGTPCYYILPKEGVDLWVGGEGLSVRVSSSQLPLVYEYLNSRLGGPWAYQAGLEAYQTPTWPSAEVKAAFPIEFYNWNFLGQATYKPISEIIPNQPAYIANALFQPDKYNWSSQPGTPDPNGNVKDRGSIENIESNIGTLETWVDNASYYISQWTTMKQV
jgi:spermidine/putrescine-binding protein